MNTGEDDRSTKDKINVLSCSPSLIPVVIPVGGPEVSLFKEALEAVGSSSLEEFVIRFNVDILSPLVKHADEEVSEGGSGWEGGMSEVCGGGGRWEGG